MFSHATPSIIVNFNIQCVCVYIYCTLYTITTWGHNFVQLQSSNERANLIYFLYIPIPPGVLGSPRVWALDASLRGSYTRFIDFLTPFLLILVMERAQDRPSALPAHWIFTDFVHVL